MNKLEEKKQNFDIDKNKQDIRRLEKLHRSQGEDIAALNQFKATTNKDLTQIQNDISDIKTDVEALKNPEVEEKIELYSYDIYRNRDNMYRNNRWDPSDVYFVCDSGSKFKLHIWFTLICTYDEMTTTETVTTTFTLDGEEIFSQVNEYSGPTTFDVDFTGFFNSKKPSHFLSIKAINSKGAYRTKYNVKPEMLNIELWGTNVMFVTRRNDFHVVPMGEKNLMTTTCLDQRARLSTQPADETLSFDISNFRTIVFNEYTPELNQIRPAAYHYMTDDGPVYADAPSVITRFFPYSYEWLRSGYVLKIKDTETEEQYPSRNQGGCDVLALGFLNLTEDDTSKIHVMMKNMQNILYSPALNFYYYQFSEIEDLEIADVMSPVRLDDMSTTTPIVCVVTRQDGTTYLFECISERTPDPKKYELGFGTNVNAYSTSEGIKIYMRVGRDTKVLLIKKNESGEYEIVSTQYLKNIQEYWHGANGTHFERVGDKIYYYLSGQTTPTNSFQLDI